MTYPIKFVTIVKASEVTGYSEKAIYAKMDKGLWLRDVHWKKAPDGRRLVNLRAVEQWADGVNTMEFVA